MKQNPCRFCALSEEYKGKHLPSIHIECGICDNRKKHEDYLKSKRMYSLGEKITKFSELLLQTYVFCGYLGRPMHIEAIKSCQLRIVLDMLEKGKFYKATKKESEEKK